ncbi:methyltransferase [Moraxella macacae 0408225]|uniref:tRNA 5-carboxymethoxyuridine methyltransferase n=1 Tax=Moraxella macacae 0408225 TaxID=1230338 RepID=L2F801_9GAMM|nr:methyltransferase [Moraxella macacae]ELA08911.1 methyltransferase [Moraxella macacae 0408225]
MTNPQDRNFNDISEHFAKKIYGGLKGQIRLAVLRHDIFQAVATYQQQVGRPLRILDVGAGLAHLSLELATQGHDVTINDISENMLAIAKQLANNLPKDIASTIHWHACPYQALDTKLFGTYDLILCHAVLEWLANPRLIIDFFDNWLIDKGLLSLCFYNPVSFTYRNLIMGNFNLLKNHAFQADNGSLTPNNPVAKDDVLAWLDEKQYQTLHISGLRVFHDYAPLKRGGHTNTQAVIDMEVLYSGQEPYKWIGRYLHVLAKKSIDNTCDLVLNTQTTAII